MTKLPVLLLLGPKPALKEEVKGRGPRPVGHAWGAAVEPGSWLQRHKGPEACAVMLPLLGPHTPPLSCLLLLPA